ncbi:MAG TPA: hypothetical protein VK524_18080 [Polyangiaceae bacterium]|nr:hypothetical protein [Polyangiaceae bacterium]
MRRRVLSLGLALVGLAAALPAQAQSTPEPPRDAPAAPEPPTSAGQTPRAPQRTLSWGTEPASPSDTGTKPTSIGARDDVTVLRWRESTLLLDQSVSTETVGVGKDIQTRNPSYDMTLLFRPRYYLYEDELQNVSLRGEIGVFHEFTNSDVTTERGETSLTDAQLFASLARTVYRSSDYRTELSLRAPILTFPTSKVSSRNGTVLGLGASFTVAQDVPLAGPRSKLLQAATAALRLGYAHTFTNSIVPTNSELARRRTDPEGRLLIDDQFGSPAFPEHEGTIRLLFDVGISERVTWGTAFTWQPLWKYKLPDTQICNVATGCVEPESVEDPQRFVVVTTFETEVAWDPIDEASVALGYSNLTSQVGSSGERRNVFYSPAARFYLTLTANLDEIYLTAKGRQGRHRQDRDLARSGPHPGASRGSL